MSNFYVCCIARLEGRYIREFVEHYLSLGFTKVIICDNNHDGEDDLDVINDYVQQGKVIIEDYRDQVRAQMKAYTDIYAKYGNECDAIMYVDVDEFLILNKHNNIQEFIESFPNDWEVILTNWMTMGDNNQINADYSKPLMERFTEARPMAKSQYDFVDDFHVKSIVKGGLDSIVFYGNPHTPCNSVVCYHSNGKRCNCSPFQVVDHSVAYLKHFTTKSCEEYCNKLRKGTADRDYQTFLQTYGRRYFLINEKTDEKVKYFEERGYSGI